MAEVGTVTDTITEAAETKRWSNCSRGSGSSLDNETDDVSAFFQTAARRSSKLIRRTSSIVWEETRPATPAGWTIFTAAIVSAILRYEQKLQRSLTCPPLVFFQHDEPNEQQYTEETMRKIYQILSQKPNGILAQPVQPSLWVGTRGTIASSMALIAGRPHRRTDRHVRFREILTMAIDGATLALDWEMLANTHKDPQQYILKGPIDKPVVLILHGINNDSNAGYIRALQRTMTDRGHIAVGMNFRGCGGVPLSTPRGYNGAYTGDLRCVVQSIQARLANPSDIPVFLTGHSLGANLVAKYLGEEGLSGTLPECIAGGACLGNPLEIHSKNNMHTPWKQILAWGVKLDLALQWQTYRKIMVYPEVKRAIWNALKASHIHEVDEALCPITLRNDPYYPFATSIGYKNGEEYWDDASSYKYIRHINVPLLKIIAGDDKVVYHSFQRKLTHNIMNPNIMSVETKCGGHLGWQESPPRDGSEKSSSIFSVGPSWAGRATADFIDAVIQTRKSGGVETVSKDSLHAFERPTSHVFTREYLPSKPTIAIEQKASASTTTRILNGAVPKRFVPVLSSKL